MRRVVVVGDIVTDTVAVHERPLSVGSDTPARITVGGGGSAANTAAWLAWLGVPVTLVAVVGDDPAGSARLDELARAGVGLAVRRHRDLPTGTVVVLATAEERTMLVDRGANAALVPDDVRAALAGAGHLHLSGYPLFDPATRPAALTALSGARGHGATTSVDAASAAPLRAVGGAAFLRWVHQEALLLANVDEARALLAVPAGDRALGSDGDRDRSPPAAVLASRLARQLAQVVVKRGARGALWAAGDQVTGVPAEPATVVDPTGAGDAFAAGLLAAWLDGGGPAAALASGARTAALAVAVPGGRPGGNPPTGSGPGWSGPRQRPGGPDR